MIILVAILIALFTYAIVFYLTFKKLTVKTTSKEAPEPELEITPEVCDFVFGQA
jgi:hypothetical protein